MIVLSCLAVDKPIRRAFINTQQLPFLVALHPSFHCLIVLRHGVFVVHTECCPSPKKEIRQVLRNCTTTITLAYPLPDGMVECHAYNCQVSYST